MRWRFVKPSDIDNVLRETFEQYGVVSMQILLATNNTTFRHEGNLRTVESVLPSLLKWLREQYQLAELKETWLITMEAVITVFVVAELLLTAYQLFCRVFEIADVPVEAITTYLGVLLFAQDVEGRK